jgi:hypothetical protein
MAFWVIAYACFWRALFEAVIDGEIDVTPHQDYSVSRSMRVLRAAEGSVGQRLRRRTGVLPGTQKATKPNDRKGIKITQANFLRFFFALQYSVPRRRKLTLEKILASLVPKTKN